MSRYSCGLRPVFPGIVIRDFRVSGLPDPVDGGDAIPFRYITGGKVGNVLGVTVPLSWVTGPVDNYAIAAHGLGSVAVQVTLTRAGALFLAPWKILDENRVEIHVAYSFSSPAQAFISAIIP